MKHTLKARILPTLQWLIGLDIPLYAANSAYFIVLAVFPALLLMLSGLRYTGLQVEDLLELLGGLFPAAVTATVRDLVYSVYDNASGAVAGVSALTALWSSSRGIYGLLTGLNAIYGVAEDRSYLYTRGISVLYTFLFGLVLLLTLVLHVFGNALIRLLNRIPYPAIAFALRVLNLRFFFLLFLQSLLFTAMFMFFPNHRNRFLQSLPGGLLASIGWLIFSNVYSFYVSHFPSYANIYGSVYALAISMLWLYFCMGILFLGGALNRMLMKKAP